MEITIYNDSDNPTPKYATDGSAGFDVQADMKNVIAVNAKVNIHTLHFADTLMNGIELFSNERVLIPTGLYLSIPKNTELQIRPRSGLAIKQGLGIINSPGTLDCDYRGELCICVINLGIDPITILHGDKIAQCVLAPYIKADFKVVESIDDLDRTLRGEGGFGHTGK